MAYRFNGSGDYVRFNPAPLSGYTIGAVTIAALFKRSDVTGTDYAIAIIDSGLSGWRAVLAAEPGPKLSTVMNLGGSGATFTGFNDTTKWFLGVMTWGGTNGTKPRMHLHDGTGWTHSDATNNVSNFGTVAGTDHFTVGGPTFGGAQGFPGDIVCAGIKKATSSDATVETLSPTLFSAWRSFGFDWLIGFDSSLEAAGILQDQASPGTGDETAISGTSAVADPAGWAWTGTGAAPFVPQVVIT
jgi:hypothetical protein